MDLNKLLLPNGKQVPSKEEIVEKLVLLKSEGVTHEQMATLSGLSRPIVTQICLGNPMTDRTHMKCILSGLMHAEKRDFIYIRILEYCSYYLDEGGDIDDILYDLPNRISEAKDVIEKKRKDNTRNELLKI